MDRFDSPQRRAATRVDDDDLTALEALRAGWAGERFDRDYIVSLIPEP